MRFDIRNISKQRLVGILVLAMTVVIGLSGNLYAANVEVIQTTDANANGTPLAPNANNGDVLVNASEDGGTGGTGTSEP